MACSLHIKNIWGMEINWFINEALAENLEKGEIILMTINCSLGNWNQTTQYKVKLNK